MSNHIMVDLETTGTDQAYNHIIQISAVRFDLEAGTVDHDFFDRCLLPAPNRYWQESCREWWGKRPTVLRSIMDRMEDPEKVLVALRDWAGQDAIMWSKPSHFDHSFLDGYFKQYGMQIPFMFRNVNDMNSFIRSRYWPETPPNWERDLPFTGEVHNALHDTLHQIKVLFKVMEDTRAKT